MLDNQVPAPKDGLEPAFIAAAKDQQPEYRAAPAGCLAERCLI